MKVHSKEMEWTEKFNCVKVNKWTQNNVTLVTSELHLGKILIKFYDCSNFKKNDLKQ